jgi:hypothetical protein
MTQWLPPPSLRELEVRWRSNQGVRFADDLQQWRTQAVRWLSMEAGKSHRSAKSWERKGKPEVAKSWEARAAFCERLLTFLT